MKLGRGGMKIALLEREPSANEQMCFMCVVMTLAASCLRFARPVWKGLNSCGLQMQLVGKVTLVVIAGVFAEQKADDSDAELHSG